MGPDSLTLSLKAGQLNVRSYKFVGHYCVSSPVSQTDANHPVTGEMGFFLRSECFTGLCQANSDRSPRIAGKDGNLIKSNGLRPPCCQATLLCWPLASGRRNLLLVFFLLLGLYLPPHQWHLVCCQSAF